MEIPQLQTDADCCTIGKGDYLSFRKDPLHLCRYFTNPPKNIMAHTASSSIRERIVQVAVKKGGAVLAVLAILLTIAGCATPGGVAPQTSGGNDPATLDVGAALRAADRDAQQPDLDRKTASRET